MLTITQTWVDRSGQALTAGTITVTDPSKGNVATFSTDAMFSVADGSPCSTGTARAARCAVDVGVAGSSSGSFTVSETPPSGLFTTFLGGCQFTGEVDVEPGLAAQCAIADTRKDQGSVSPTGDLTVTQGWMDRSGTALQTATITVKDHSLTTVATFNTNLMHSNAGGGCSTETKRRAGCVIEVGVVGANGPFTVSEAVASGQAATFGESCSFQGSVNVSAGETAVCALTDTRPLTGSAGPTGVIELSQSWLDRKLSNPQAATITVKDHSGATVAAFTTNVMRTPTGGACNTVAARLAGCVIEVGVAGTFGSPFTVSETVPSGQVATFGGGCSFSGSVDVSAGQTASCSVLDTQPLAGSAAPTSMVEMSHSWLEHLGGTLPSASIAVKNGVGTTVASFNTDLMRTTSGGGCNSEANRRLGCVLEVGVVGANGPFTVSQSAPTGWIVTFGSDCTNGSVNVTVSGEEATCSLTLVKF